MSTLGFSGKGTHPELDGEHLCEDCYQEFRSFMDNKIAK